MPGPAREQVLRTHWSENTYHMGTVQMSSCLTDLDLPKLVKQGSGCGAVGRAVASYTRGPRFESSHRQKFIYVKPIL